MPKAITKKEFKDALLKGRGCCFAYANKDFEKYASVLLWACSRNISFDTQCEGSKAWYLYELIKCGNNKAPFAEAAANSLLKCRNAGGWRILYLSELLGCFANDGEKTAQEALELEYSALYSRLMKGDQRETARNNTVDDFEQICQVITGDSVSFLKTAEDIGRLFKRHKYFDASDFAWFYGTKGEKYSALTKRQAKKSEYIAEFLKSGREYDEKTEKARKSFTANKPQSGAGLSMWLKRQADSDVILQYAKAYIDAKETKARAEALWAFCCCAYPNEPAPIIEDAKSNNNELKTAAWVALENIRHRDVRQFAIANLQQNKEYALPVFIRNYEPKDADILERLVKEVPIDFNDTTGWHSLHLDVINMDDHGLKASGKLLKFIYENTYCSVCRGYVLRQLGKRRMLTEDILTESLHDSNEDIRIYAEKHEHMIDKVEG